MRRVLSFDWCEMRTLCDAAEQIPPEVTSPPPFQLDLSELIRQQIQQQIDQLDPNYFPNGPEAFAPEPPESNGIPPLNPGSGINPINYPANPMPTAPPTPVEPPPPPPAEDIPKPTAENDDPEMTIIAQAPPDGDYTTPAPVNFDEAAV